MSKKSNLLELYPEIAAQWHPTKNGDLKPEGVSYGSQIKVWWKCSKGPDHEWPAKVGGRTFGKGCPCCSGYQVSITNNLATEYPEISNQWHPTKNRGLAPSQIVSGSSKEVWWKCVEGPDHEWCASPSRVVGNHKAGAGNGIGCPYCAGKRVSISNSLAINHPEIAAQWHPTKNSDLRPEEVVFGSGAKVWWKCPKGPDHEWQARIVARTNQNSGCPCCRGSQLSITNSLATLYPQIAAQWHPGKNGKLTPENTVAGTANKVWWQCDQGLDHEWRVAVISRTHFNSGCPYCAKQKVSVTNCLANVRPDIAKEWHPIKNGRLTPDQMVDTSHKKVWWKCNAGPDHEWQAFVDARTRSGSGCPCCSGRKISVTNSLATLFPGVAESWHPTKNGDLTPSQVAAGTTKKVWWKCVEGADHEWQNQVVQRTFFSESRKATGCPYCAGKKASVTNNLAALHPEIANLWHPTKNGDLSPNQVVAGSNKKYWWKCAEGSDHEWQASSSAISQNQKKHNGSGCPYCSGKRVSVTNSLAGCYPEIAKQWHTNKNGDLTPQDIVAGTHKKVWWQCDKGPDHEWRASADTRIRGHGCPCCTSKKVSVTNSLASLFPQFCNQWHPTKNGKLKPDQVTSGSGKKVWWQCEKGPDHEWQCSPSSRTSGERLGGCPSCSGRQLSITNSLSTISPQVAKEWHPTKNKDLTPAKVTANSARKVWWLCKHNPSHQWRAQISNRSNGTGCPECNPPFRSRIEIHLAYELSSFLSLDVGDINIETSGNARNLLVDIKVSQHKLIIEYDGSYWHGVQGKKDIDREKTEQLTQLGWKVIRIRLDEQGKITDDDILMTADEHEETKTVAEHLILKLVELGYLQQSDYDSYRARDNLIKAEKAEAYIQQLLAAKRREDQLELFEVAPS